jgi:hypothetical protein
MTRERSGAGAEPGTELAEAGADSEVGALADAACVLPSAGAGSVSVKIRTSTAAGRKPEERESKDARQAAPSWKRSLMERATNRRSSVARRSPRASISAERRTIAPASSE